MDPNRTVLDELILLKQVLLDQVAEIDETIKNLPPQLLGKRAIDMTPEKSALVLLNRRPLDRP